MFWKKTEAFQENKRLLHPDRKIDADKLTDDLNQKYPALDFDSWTVGKLIDKIMKPKGE